METLTVRTGGHAQFLDITDQVQEVVKSSGVSSGVARVYVPHTTAGVTINENADPDVVHDILEDLDRLIPQTETYYRHGEGNSPSHMKASLMGSCQTVLVENGRLVLGTWQGIYFCEFDGPRTRRVHVQVTAA
jgi:secondary thiamine-phosphate synthase enzyme